METHRLMLISPPQRGLSTIWQFFYIVKGELGELPTAGKGGFTSNYEPKYRRVFQYATDTFITIYNLTINNMTPNKIKD